MPTLIYKKQLISGAPAVTDNVEAGNMKPVTSNAVSGAIKELPYILSATDLNNCYATKNAIITYRTVTNCLNVPVADKNFIVTVHTYNDGTNIRIHQLASFHGAESADYSYTRTAFGTVAGGLTWTNWEKLLTESDNYQKVFVYTTNNGVFSGKFSQHGTHEITIVDTSDRLKYIKVIYTTNGTSLSIKIIANHELSTSTYNALGTIVISGGSNNYKAFDKYYY